MNPNRLNILKRLSPLLIIVVAFLVFQFFTKDELADYNDKVLEDQTQYYAKFTTEDELVLTFKLDTAKTSFEKAKGLMYVTEYPANKAMYFANTEDVADKYWMKNTMIPLDIIFLDKENEIVFIEKNAQPCKVEDCPLYGPDKSYRSVIEINGGLSEKYGFKVGDKVEFTLESAN